MEYSLRSYLPQILKYLDFDNLSPYLLCECLLTSCDLEKLRKCESKEELVMLLIAILQTKGDNMYRLFRRAMERSVAVDDCSCHLGHVELLKILPNPAPSVEDTCGLNISGLSISQQQSSSRKCELTDSGLVDSFECVSGESTFKGGERCWKNVTDSLSFVASSWQRVQMEVKHLRERNHQLEREKGDLIEMITKERNEVQHMKTCVKKMIQPYEYPVSAVIPQLLSEMKRNQSLSHVVLVVLDRLSNGEILHTCSLIISGLFALPYSVPLKCLQSRSSMLQSDRPVYLQLPSDNFLKITIIDSGNYFLEREKPDLVISVCSRTDTISQEMMLGYSVLLSLDHSLNTEPPIQEGAPVIHPFPIHHHSMCLSYHLSHLFAACIDKASNKLQQQLVECNRMRLKQRQCVSSNDVLTYFDAFSIHEMQIFCF